MMGVIACTVFAFIFLGALVATLEHLDTRAREQRWQRALASFDMADTRTPLVEPPTTKQKFSLKGPTKL